MKRVGIFGGSFDPIHTGHIKIASIAKDDLKLESVIFIPSGSPPHKTTGCIADKSDRLNMTRLAVRDYPEFTVSDYEITKPGYSYSVDTIRHFKETLPKDTLLYFLMGGDSLLEFHLWKSIEEISRLCTIVAINRDKDENLVLLNEAKKFLKDKFNTDVIIIPVPQILVSSTAIRENIALLKPISEFVPNSVLEYIKKHKLYQG